MPNEAYEKGAQIGQALGGVLQTIVGGNDMGQQAELAAQMFEGTGHPTGAQIAEVLRDDPRTAFEFLQQMGGMGPAFERITRLQAAAREQGAVDAQNQAILGQARIPIQGLPPAQPRPEWGPSGGTPAFNPNVPDPRAGPSRLQLALPDLERVATAGGDLGATIGTMKKLGISFGMEPAENVLKEVGVDPDSNTGESVDAFLQHYAQTGQKKFSILKPRVTPKDKSAKPPAGTFFVPDPTAPSGVRVVAIPGSHAEITQKADQIRLKLANGDQLSAGDQAFLDSVDRVGAIQSLLNQSIRPPQREEMP